MDRYYKLCVINYEVNTSRFVVTLHNINLVDKEAIQKMGARDVLLCDSTGAIYEGRGKGMNPYKDQIAAVTNFSHGARTDGKLPPSEGLHS